MIALAANDDDPVTEKFDNSELVKVLKENIKLFYEEKELREKREKEREKEFNCIKELLCNEKREKELKEVKELLCKIISKDDDNGRPHKTQ